jgi:hypothetical protein
MADAFSHFLNHIIHSIFSEGDPMNWVWEAVYMGVNETEIDKILNEVEELRKELTSETSGDVMAEFRETPTPASPVEAELTAETLSPSSTGSDSDMEATLASLKGDAGVRTLFDEDPTGPAVSVPAQTAAKPTPKPELKVVETTPASATVTRTDVPGELTMNLSGSMSLKLKYQFEGQEVFVSFADGTLLVELADGSEIKIPLTPRKTTGKRKVS